MTITVTIAIVVIVLVGIVLALAANRPNEFAVQRAVRIRATPERIFPHIADFHRWAAWSPWEKLDPAMRRTHSGAPTGPGSVYEWEGNSKVGTGRMEILQLTPPTSATVKLDFLKPFEAHNTAAFTLVPSGDGTDVTWKMYGPSPFVTKVMGVFFNMDDMVGKDFERGLANLKSVAEG
jgi:uncharacterized protein YndB with AHSA1/START domain